MSNQVAENQNEMSMVHMSTTDMILDYRAMEQMDRLANLMASGKSTVPAHLQGNPADCMAIIMQSAQWKMNPYAVGQKTHVVNGTLGYEAQLINAVVSSSKAIQNAFAYEWYGPWEKVIGKFETKTNQAGKPYQVPGWKPADEIGCGIKVSALLRGETIPRELDLLLLQAQVRNSTLWASDPKQQLAYLAVKRWARLYAPAVILGVYSSDELEPINVAKERVVNPESHEDVSEIVEKDVYTQEQFNEFANVWANAIQAKKTTPANIIKKISKIHDVPAEIIKQIEQLTQETVQ